MARLPRKKPSLQASLQYITNYSTRRFTFRKRCKSIFKKIHELSVLCDVRACAVVYEPGEAEPKVWPNNDKARNVLQEVKDLPAIARFKKKISQEEFLGERVTKLKEQVEKQMQENKNLEITTLMLQVLTGKSLQDLGLAEALALEHHVQEKLNEIRERLASMMPGGASGNEPVEATAEAEVGPSGSAEVHAP